MNIIKTSEINVFSLTKLRWIYLLIITPLLLLSCKKETTSTSDTKQTTEQKMPVENSDDENILITKAQFESNKMALGQLGEHLFPEIVKTTGMIDIPPQGKEIISSFYGGFIKKSSLLIGDKVRKGQALVTLENPDFIDMQQDYLETKEQLTYLKSEYKRQKTLFEENITSEKNYLKSESEYKRKVASLKGLRKKLQLININISNLEQGNITSRITLFSSISGSVSKINVSKGTPISPADEIMEIINTDHIHIELTVFEKDAMKIKKGQKIRFKISEISDTYYDAEVHLVGKTIDEKTRTIKVHGHLHRDTKNKFDPGMFVDASIEINTNKAMGLPETTVIEQGEKKVILKLDKEENGTYYFETITVEIGNNYDGFTQIDSDNLKLTDQFLTKGGYALISDE